MRSNTVLKGAPYSHPIPIEQRLIVPLDVPDQASAFEIVDELGEAVQFYKIGLQFIFGGGIDFVKELHARGKQVFLDAKLNDIDQTIGYAIESIVRLNVAFVTVHGENGKAVREAVKAKGFSPLKIFIVTVLTSMDQHDMHDLGITKMSLTDHVIYRARNAVEAGASGVIASGLEVAEIKRQFPSLLVITPGIRSHGVAHDDQKRVVAPAQAIRNGADYIVVGRQITGNPDRKRAAKLVLDEMRAGAAESGP